MAKILITSGPTRQYIDPIRYLTNASSGRTGAALARAALAAGNDVIIISGPVDIDYPPEAEVVSVVSTEDMLKEALRYFPQCDGVIGVAAPCDYRPVTVAENKLSKEDMTRTNGANGEFLLKLIETPDIMASLAAHRRTGTGTDVKSRWMVAFALETTDHRAHALQKLQRKCCDLIILNDSTAINGPDTSVEILDPSGQTVGKFTGSKSDVAVGIINVIMKKTPSFSFATQTQ